MPLGVGGGVGAARAGRARASGMRERSMVGGGGVEAIVVVAGGGRVRNLACLNRCSLLDARGLTVVDAFKLVTWWLLTVVK